MSYFYKNIAIRLVMSVVICFCFINKIVVADAITITSNYDTQFANIDTKNNSQVCSKVNELLRNKTIKYGNFNVAELNNDDIVDAKSLKTAYENEKIENVAKKVMLETYSVSNLLKRLKANAVQEDTINKQIKVQINLLSQAVTKENRQNSKIEKETQRLKKEAEEEILENQVREELLNNNSLFANDSKKFLDAFNNEIENNKKIEEQIKKLKDAVEQENARNAIIDAETKRLKALYDAEIKSNDLIEKTKNKLKLAMEKEQSEAESIETKRRELKVAYDNETNNNTYIDNVLKTLQDKVTKECQESTSQHNNDACAAAKNSYNDFKQNNIKSTKAKKEYETYLDSIFFKNNESYKLLLEAKKIEDEQNDLIDKMTEKLKANADEEKKNNEIIYNTETMLQEISDKWFNEHPGETCSDIACEMLGIYREQHKISNVAQESYNDYIKTHQKTTIAQESYNNYFNNYNPDNGYSSGGAINAYNNYIQSHTPSYEAKNNYDNYIANNKKATSAKEAYDNYIANNKPSHDAENAYVKFNEANQNQTERQTKYTNYIANNKTSSVAKEEYIQYTSTHNTTTTAKQAYENELAKYNETDIAKNAYDKFAKSFAVAKGKNSTIDCDYYYNYTCVDKNNISNGNKFIEVQFSNTDKFGSDMYYCDINSIYASTVDETLVKDTATTSTNSTSSTSSSIKIYSDDIYREAESNGLATAICKAIDIATQLMVPLFAIMFSILGLRAFQGKMELSVFFTFAIGIAAFKGAGSILEFLLPDMGLQYGCNCAVVRYIRNSDGVVNKMETGLNEDCSDIAS